MQVIGICRFSYPGQGGFQVEHETLDDRIAYLYATERMEERFRTFEAFTLPPLRTQTDDDYTFLVVIGDSMPDVHRQRLEALLEGMPQAVIQAHPPGRHRKVMQDAINSVRHFDNEPCLQFRMDDDDAVARRYVASLREAAQDVRKLSRKNREIAIDFNQGFLAQAGPHGISAKATNGPYTTAALALMFKPSNRLSVMNFSHVKVAQKMPTVTFTGEDMLVRGHNDYNDSRQRPGIKKIELDPLDDLGEEHFREVFNIDADLVRDLYSSS
ncbi:MAG: glycosyltransferase [Falsiruegeria mediterranea]